MASIDDRTPSENAGGMRIHATEAIRSATPHHLMRFSAQTA
jgi:hypothetical protein